MRIPRLQLKALALLVVVSLVPVAATIAIVQPSYGQAVRVNEQQHQLVVLKEGVGAVERHIVTPQLEAAAVAAALAAGSTEAMRGKERESLAAVRAVLASRPHLDAVRFEVPEASVSTVISKEGADPEQVPESTPELRREADEHGAAFHLTSADRGVVVVPVAAADGKTTPKVRGYVTTAVYLSPLSEDFAAVAQSRLANDHGASGMVLVDANRRVIAAYNAPGLEPGADGSALPLWKMVEGMQRDKPVGTQGEYEQDGTTMLGSLQSIRTVGWALAMWRPEASALADYLRMRNMLLAVGAGALLLAILVALISARAVTRPVLDMAAQAKRIGNREWSGLEAASKRRDELGDLDRAIHRMADDLQESEQEIEHQAKLRGDLSRFMSKELVDAIVSGEHSLELGGRRMEVTVLFADMVAFTPLAEGKPADQVVTMLNELFSVLTEVVFRHGGVVDKFIGDCLMAVWGAPVPVDDHAHRALAAADDMMRFLEVGVEQWREKYDAEVRLAIGINSGQAIVGNVGSDKRMEYTVVGDTVNVAARLENIAAPNQVLVGERTHALAGDDFDLELLGARQLTGRQAETDVYELETD